MKFTRKTDYALRAMQYLARQEQSRVVSVRTVAENTGLAVKFLQGIVSELVKNGLVDAVSGPGGGIRLSKPPEQVPVLDIIEAVEGRISLMECFEHPKDCSQFQACGIMNVLIGAQDALIHHLKRTTLKLMVSARNDPFGRVPEGHYQKPQYGCPVLR